MLSKFCRSASHFRLLFGEPGTARLARASISGQSLSPAGRIESPSLNVDGPGFQVARPWLVRDFYITRDLYLSSLCDLRIACASADSLGRSLQVQIFDLGLAGDALRNLGNWV